MKRTFLHCLEDRETYLKFHFCRKRHNISKGKLWLGQVSPSHRVHLRDWGGRHSLLKIIQTYLPNKRQLKALLHFIGYRVFSVNALVWIAYRFNKRSSESQPRIGFPGPKEGSLFIVSLRFIFAFAWRQALKPRVLWILNKWSTI